MREPEIIMQTIGDDPLTELMELDSIYGWTRRIRTLASLFERRKRSKAPYVLMVILLLMGAGLISAGIILAYISLS
jgi:hypothetical protein